MGGRAGPRRGGEGQRSGGGGGAREASCRWAGGLFLRTGSYERDFHVREGRTTVIFVTVNVFVDLTLCCS